MAALPKRKTCDYPDQAPPAKRATNVKVSDDNDGSDVNYDGEADLPHDLDTQAAMCIGTIRSSREWEDSILKVMRNVVAIKFCHALSFDTESALASEASGFVVDAQRG